MTSRGFAVSADDTFTQRRWAPAVTCRPMCAGARLPPCPVLPARWGTPERCRRTFVPALGWVFVVLERPSGALWVHKGRRTQIAGCRDCERVAGGNPNSFTKRRPIRSGVRCGGTRCPTAPARKPCRGYCADSPGPLCGLLLLMLRLCSGIVARRLAGASPLHTAAAPRGNDMNEAESNSIIRPAGDWWEMSPPKPIIWRARKPNGKGDAVDAVLSVGEVALLSGAGGLGKSTITRLVALAGATAAGKYGDACGLQVAAGPVVLVSYEDNPIRIAQHLKRLNPERPKHLLIWPDPTPLWDSNRRRTDGCCRCKEWSRFWATVKEKRVQLVVIDPANVAFSGASPNDGGPVREFLFDLSSEANKAECGVLIVTHDTKAARNAAEAGEDPGAGAVAGAAAWSDGARGVMTLTRVSKSTDRIIRVTKANYGPSGWSIRLKEQFRDGLFSGYALGESIAPEGLKSRNSQSGTRSGRNTPRATAATNDDLSGIFKG